jgi:hypothetical protein
MAETFEIAGTVVALEQKKYRDGRGPIPGFWNVKLQTEQGERSCSFNSERRTNPRDSESPTEPHPDFALIQRAQVSGEKIRIAGRVTYKGEGENRRGFKNGVSAHFEASSPESPSGPSAPGASAAAPADGDEVKWAVENVLPEVVDGPLDDDDVAAVKDSARRLIEATHELADETTETKKEGSAPADLDAHRKRRRSTG